MVARIFYALQVINEHLAFQVFSAAQLISISEKERSRVRVHEHVLKLEKRFVEETKCKKAMHSLVFILSNTHFM